MTASVDNADLMPRGETALISANGRIPSATDLARFVEFAPAAMAMCDREMRYLVVNRQWQRDLSLANQDLIGRSHYEIVRDVPVSWRAAHERCLDGATETCDEDRFVRPDGTVSWHRWELHPWRDDDGSIGGILIFCEDITARKQLELAMLASTSREQQRFGRDLHDGLGQDLTAISLLASALATREFDTRAGFTEFVMNLARLAQHAVATCRAMAHGMSPLQFAGNDLVQALRDMLELQVGAFGLKTELVVNGESLLRLDAFAAENLYRIAQEAVPNARHHGHAKSIRVVLDIGECNVRLDVLDDGVGLNASHTKGNGIGLKVMGVRAGLIGAQFSIGAAPGAGTQVSVTCPQPPGPIRATPSSRRDPGIDQGLKAAARGDRGARTRKKAPSPRTAPSR